MGRGVAEYRVTFSAPPVFSHTGRRGAQHHPSLLCRHRSVQTTHSAIGIAESQLDLQVCPAIGQHNFLSKVLIHRGIPPISDQSDALPQDSSVGAGLRPARVIPFSRAGRFLQKATEDTNARTIRVSAARRALAPFGTCCHGVGGPLYRIQPGLERIHAVYRARIGLQQLHGAPACVEGRPAR